MGNCKRAGRFRFVALLVIALVVSAGGWWVWREDRRPMRMRGGDLAAMRPASEVVGPRKVIKSERDRLEAEESDKLRERLRRPLPDIKFDAVAFAEIVEQIRNVTDDNIFINWKTLNAAGVTRDMPVTVELNGLTEAEGIQKLLQDVGGDIVRLGYRIDNGVLTISTHADLDGETYTRVYDVRKALKDPATRKQDLDTLLRRVKSIEPVSWRLKGQGCSVKELSGQLIITQRPDVHRRLRALLRDLSGAPPTVIEYED